MINCAKTALSLSQIASPSNFKKVDLTKSEPFSTIILGTATLGQKETLVTSDYTLSSPKAKQTTLVNVSPLSFFPNQMNLQTEYSQGGSQAVTVQFEHMLGTSTNKIVEMNYDEFGQLVQAIGGIVLQNESSFVSKGYKFDQGTIHLNTNVEVSAYLTLLNEKDAQKYTERLQAVAMATFEHVKSPTEVLSHYLQIMEAFPKVVKTNMSFDDFRNLLLNYRGALSINKINVHTTKSTDRSVSNISQATLDEVKTNFESKSN